MRVAIVGAGVAGLVLGGALREAGHDVHVFDKGRSVGGRLATRRKEQGAFDHGAQRFSARSESFRAAVARWESAGIVVRTEPASDEPWWLPVPSANALAQSLAVGLTVRTSTRVVGLRRSDHAWRLGLEGGADEGRFDVVLVTAPAPQAAQLLAPHHVFADELARVRYEPTWALMLVCDHAGVTWPESIFSEGAPDDPIALLVREGKKPGRLADDSLVRLTVHASSAFSRENLEAAEDVVAPLLIAALRERPGLDALRPRFVQAQRWRYARVAEPLGATALYEPSRGLGIAGDYCVGPRIEAAFQSGLALAALVGAP